MSRKFNAILGLGALAAFGFASSAFAQCPASPVPPWSSQSTLGGSVTIVSGGFDGTACRMDSALTSNIGGASAFVRDNTPADEPRYRAQFIVDVDNLTGLNTIQTVKIFSASTENPADGIAEVVRLGLFGNISGTTKSLSVLTYCQGQSGNLCSASAPLAAGENRIEIDWVKGSPGHLRVWVNNTNEASPTLDIPANNAASGGIDYAVLGLSAGSAAFRSSQLSRAVKFDEFDSRRQTFIGN